MYRSLKQWIKVPVNLLRFVSRNGAGDCTFSQAESMLVYPVSEITVVRDASGTEVTSNTQLYIDGTEVLNDADHIIFEGVEWPILAIRTFYRNGVPDLKVVYL